MSTDTLLTDSGRKHPARGVLVLSQQPTIVFLTVCTKDRQLWLARKPVQTALTKIWQNTGTWLVGDYLLMPDHIHLFCAPRDIHVTLQRWVSYWKREFSCLHLPETGEWLRNFGDTRLRCGENYAEKWNYVCENPVRARLVEKSDNWPFKGQLHRLPW